MKVHIIIYWYDYGESHNVERVFSSRKKAENYVKSATFVPDNFKWYTIDSLHVE